MAYLKVSMHWHKDGKRKNPFQNPPGTNKLVAQEKQMSGLLLTQSIKEKESFHLFNR